MIDEFYLMDEEKREWIKDVVLFSKMIIVVYYNVLIVVVEFKKVLELFYFGFRFKGEFFVELYIEVLSVWIWLKVVWELVKLFIMMVDFLGFLIVKLDLIV